MDYQTEDTERTAVDVSTPTEIERLAREIERLRWIHAAAAVSGRSKSSMEENCVYVRAILTAMREPSHEITREMHEATKLEFDLHAAYAKIWRAGIDHILNEKP